MIIAMGAMSVTAPAFASNFLTGQTHIVSGPIQAPESQIYTVELNKTEVVHLSAPASAVIIGNPNIADISIHSSRTIFVIGRSYGETNLTVLDTSGRTILDADIQVSNNVARNGVRVFFGGDGRETYHCSPYCAAAPVLGDSPGFIGANSAGGGGINNTIALGSNPGGGGAGGGGFSGGGAGGSSLSGGLGGGSPAAPVTAAPLTAAPSSFGS